MIDSLIDSLIDFLHYPLELEATSQSTRKYETEPQSGPTQREIITIQPSATDAMINSANSLHILHRANTQLSQQQQQQQESTQDKGVGENDSDNFHENETTINQGQPSDQDNDPLVSPLMPQGLEYEVASCGDQSKAQEDRVEETVEDESGKYSSKECKLSFFFVMLVFAGVGSILAAKLQAVSMYNYGVFLSLFSYVVYVPLCFAFIIPTAKYGWFENAIPPEHTALPKRPFAIMGFLDCLAAVMQTFASIYLPGSLLVLLPQASIPLSMVLSKNMLGERYRSPQYIGATVVFVGVLLVLEPTITHRHEPDFLCEAIDLENHCTVCSGAKSRETCLQVEDTVKGNWLEENFAFPYHLNASIDILVNPTLRESMRVMHEQDDKGSAEATICHWIPHDEASAEREWSVFIWSIVMVLSCVPMTLSR